jgi:hypothetical protein
LILIVSEHNKKEVKDISSVAEVVKEEEQATTNQVFE